MENMETGEKYAVKGETVIATDGADTIDGTAGNDTIKGLGGNDTIYGGEDGSNPQLLVTVQNRAAVM